MQPCTDRRRFIHLCLMPGAGPGLRRRMRAAAAAVSWWLAATLSLAPLVACTDLDAKLAPDQEAYVADAMAFTGAAREKVLEGLMHGRERIAAEWLSWEKNGRMTDDRVKAFYKQTTNYIYDLGQWHLWDHDKRASDARLVEDLKTLGAKSILDFGGGVGFNALMLAGAGFDVTLADLDSASLEFAQFRAKRRALKMRIWKTDLEPMPPLAKYDVILALDVLEHLPKEVLEDSVTKLVRLKHAHTRVILSAPFGRTSTHPMHLDATEHTKQQVQRLLNALPSS